MNGGQGTPHAEWREDASGGQSSRMGEKVGQNIVAPKIQVVRLRLHKIGRRPVLLISICTALFATSLIAIPNNSHAVNASCSNSSGDISIGTVSGDTVETFTVTSENTDATCSFIVPDNVYVLDYLIVGGGGGGSSGGGGGGGVATSWQTRWHDGTSAYSNSTPQSVTPGQVLSITVGHRGANGWGGSQRCAYDVYTGQKSFSYGICGPSSNPLFTFSNTHATNGGDSVLGSIYAKGGGAGGGGDGGAGYAGASGGSGGGAAFDITTQSSASSQSTVVGANSFGNSGGGNSGVGYYAGAGGGGAGKNVTIASDTINGGIGASSRQIPYAGGSYGNGTLSSGSTHGGGGNGGRGIQTDISGVWNEYGCGGGGGVNNNSGAPVPGGGGAGGCSTAGNGSSYATFINNRGSQFNGSSGSPHFGGGGGGTDPEDIAAGDGGSGVVIIRFSPVNVSCPYSADTQVSSTPIACPGNVTVTAGSGSVSLNLNSISYVTAGNSPTITLITTVTGLTASTSGTTFTVSAPLNSTLVGGTYPFTYTIGEGVNTSARSYILVTVNDPNQYSPITLPIDPRAISAAFPPIQIGNANPVLVCVTASADSYTNREVPTFVGNTSNITYSVITNGFTLAGTNANVQAQLQNILINKNSSDNFLLPGSSPRLITTNVSSTANGGNGSCTFGTQHTVKIVPYDLSMVITQKKIDLGHH